MRKFTAVCCAVLFLAISLPLPAQRATRTGTPPSTPSGNSNSSGTTGKGSQRSEPCWKVAGVSQSAIKQRRTIEQNAKAQIAAVCADSSLTAQQSHQKIREIREQAQQQIQALITPQQQDALKACRESRGGAHEGGHPAGGTGPCGETPTPAPASPGSQ